MMDHDVIILGFLPAQRYP